MTNCVKYFSTKIYINIFFFFRKFDKLRIRILGKYEKKKILQIAIDNVIAGVTRGNWIALIKEVERATRSKFPTTRHAHVLSDIYDDLSADTDR